MCKLLIMSGMDPKKKKLNWDFIKTMGDLMSDNNKDGLGYTAVDKEGKLFGERWLFNWQAFENRNQYTVPKKREHEKFAGIKNLLKDFITLEDEPDEVAFEKYGYFGKRTDEISAITLHTRMATTEKGYKNVHPFVDEEKDTSLIHNGIIQNVSKADHIRSTCDSERILNKYLKHEVYKVPADIQNMIEELKGYFACGIFSRDRDGRRILDVFKSRANLSGVIVKELNCLVISTDITDIRSACRRLGLTVVSKGDRVREDTLMRFDAITGKPILLQEYRDTARPDYTRYNGGYNHQGRWAGSEYGNHYDAEWEAMLAAQDAKAAAEEANKIADDIKKDSANVLPMYQGGTTSNKVITEADVLASQERAANAPDLPSLPAVVQAQVKEVIKRSEEVGDIIQRNSTDPMNEKEAMLDGYYLTDQKDMWIKKSGVKH